MLIKKPDDIPSSEITPKSTYLNRRAFITAAGVGLVAAAGFGLREFTSPTQAVHANTKIDGILKSPLSTTETITPIKDVANYNNYYEFSTDKYEPAGLAKDFKTRPWTVSVEGLVKKKQTFDVDAILKMATPEERIYRHRCVEGWSIVVPWVGYSFNEFIKRAEPLGKAKYVEFTTIYDPKQMPGQKSSVLKWPYVEGLRMDEAMHPLPSSLECGGFCRIRMAPAAWFCQSILKIKGIVKIRFTDDQPASTWNLSAPNEFGFYSNVNPTVDHPRWSQARERRLGEFSKRPTLMFNGYDQVAGLYSGMDLKKNF
jgi:sulfoxide reductase catalytic subunit YedY